MPEAAIFLSEITNRAEHLRGGLALFAALTLAACTTVPTPSYPPSSDPVAQDTDRLKDAEPDIDPAPAPLVTRPPTPPSSPPDERVVENPDEYLDLPGWGLHDPQPALEAFRRGCIVLRKGEPDEMLNPNLPQYGTFEDWVPACEAAFETVGSPLGARVFFETFFSPLSISSEDGDEGLLTGYYEPEVPVRIKPDETFYEPILAWPKKVANRTKVRAEINAKSARVIAYGRPIDVFFLQIQGSGRLKFADGRVIRAAYAGNNGHSYRSIGRVLIERGEVEPNQSSKRDIEQWMAENGPGASRALINENPRYIFFSEQKIFPGEGPRGAMRVPLTAVASIAVDPRFHPYGVPVWLDTTLPQKPRDYIGARTTMLVIAQDTGSAIRGPLRGDLFFGSGAAAGALAGVMKHPVRWTVLLPKTIAEKDAPVS